MSTAPIAIDASQTTPTATHQHVTFASDLGLPPGHRPASLVVRGLGNGQPFYLQPGMSSADRWYYRQAMGCVFLVIYND